MCKLDTQAQHLAAQQRVVYFGHQSSQRVFVHRAFAGPVELFASEQIRTKVVDNGLQLGVFKPELRVNREFVQQCKFGIGEVAIG